MICLYARPALTGWAEHRLAKYVSVSTSPGRKVGVQHRLRSYVRITGCVLAVAEVTAPLKGWGGKRPVTETT